MDPFNPTLCSEDMRGLNLEYLNKVIDKLLNLGLFVLILAVFCMIRYADIKMQTARETAALENNYNRYAHGNSKFYNLRKFNSIKMFRFNNPIPQQTAPEAPITAMELFGD